MDGKFIALLFGGLLLASATWADAADPALQVQNPRLQITWAGDDVRPPAFDKVMLASVELVFRDVPPLAGPVGSATTRTDFPVPERDRERMARTFDEVFRDQLSRSQHFKLVDEPGPGVLLLEPSVRDIVSHIPPDPIGMSRTYVDSVMDGTLVVDFVDATTGRTLGTTADRGRAEPPQTGTLEGLTWSNPVSNTFEIRMLARHWALGLESRLEQLYFEAKLR
jgi:hypothetical protein